MKRELMGKIITSRRLAVAAVSAALAGGAVSLPVTAGATVGPQAVLAGSVTADPAPGPAQNASADGAPGRTGRQGRGARQVSREDAEEENAIGNDPVVRKALTDNDGPEDDAPAQPAAPPAGGQDAAPSAPEGQGAAPGGAQNTVPRNPQSAAPNTAGGSAPRSALQRPAVDRRAAQSPTIQGRHHSAVPRASARRSAHVQGHRASAPQQAVATRPGAAAPANADRAWRGLLGQQSAKQRAAMWEED